MMSTVSPGETVTSQLSPSSPTEDSSGELRTDRPRLQRSIGQSKRTFRLRKSRKTHIEMTQTKLRQSDTTPEEPASIQPNAQSSLQTSSTDPPLSNIPFDSSFIRSRRSPLSLSFRKSDGDKSLNVPPADQQQYHGAAAYQHHHCHHYHHHLLPQMSDASWDEDTSSTSGYRESYSMQIVSLNGTKPPLASPDLNDMPSTSSTMTNYVAFDGSSPDCSMNGSGGEKTALLTSSQKTTSQHSLLMVFPNQDEDTLI